MRFAFPVAVCLLVIAGCGGGDGDSYSPPPPVAPTPPAVVGADGGVVTEPGGASVEFPAGALSTDTTVRIARDSTGAPAMPADLTPAGSMFVITPHGGEFAQHVTVRLPAPAATLQPNQEFKIAKAQPGGEWLVLDDTVVDAGVLSSTVGSFSFFQVVVVTYLLPIVEIPPLALTLSLACDPQCTGLLGPVTATFTVTSNDGQPPTSCPDPQWLILANPSSINYTGQGNLRRVPITAAGGSLAMTIEGGLYTNYKFGIARKCGASGSYGSYGLRDERTVMWTPVAAYPQITIVQEKLPAQLDVVEGLMTNIDALLSGGAAELLGLSYRVPTPANRAVVDWEQTNDGGQSWRLLARSFQDEANPLPVAVNIPWRYWSVRHGYVATASDQAALLRIRACYAPPVAAAPPCRTSENIRINVLQQSGLPTISAAPRSVLVRTGQTASFSVTAIGLPAPTLQWQSRAANSTGTWTNVSAGTGGTTPNYTTATLAIADNGTQYRAVATNALASAESAGATLSVSDTDVAPTISTQPAALSVTNGGDAVFAIDARGTEALSYQWFHDRLEIPGANSPVLRLNGVGTATAGRYFVTVSNNAGSVNSNNVVLTVTVGAPAAVAPSIVTQPTAITANVGSTATFAVGVDGTGPFTYQWRREGANISGATSAVYSINSVALPHAGAYSVIVTNGAGAVTSANAVLDVTTSSAPVPPSITSQPATVIIPAGGSGTLAVGATGSGPLSYQWYRDGVLLQGSTAPVLIFRNFSESELGSYVVTITNDVSTVTSQAAQVIMLGAPAIIQQPADASALEGEIATFFVVANGSGLHYQWLVNGTPAPGYTGATFRTDPLVNANSGAVYQVLVYNAAGLVYSRSAVLTVQTITAPSITQHPQSVTIQPGAQAQMCVTVAGTPTFDLQLERWNGTTWVSGAGTLLNNNSQVCYFTDPLTLADTGAQFRYHVANPAGQINSNVAIVTVQAPIITSTTLVSRAIGGGPPDNISDHPSMSADGRYVAFISVGTNLSADAPTNGNAYVRDLVTGATKLVNYNSSGNVSSQGVFEVKLSSNGRYAVFTSRAGDLVAGDTNNGLDVFRRDLVNNTTQRLSLLPNGDQLPFGIGGNGEYQLDISGDGNVVIFRCGYAIEGNGVNNDNYFLYYRNVSTGLTRKIAGRSTEDVYYSALSDDGRWVAYTFGTPPPADQVFEIYDIDADAHGGLLSFTQSGAQTGVLREGINISSNGRFVTFAIASQNYLGTPQSQVLVVDQTLPGESVIASTLQGVAGNGGSAWPQISGDGRYVLFSTYAPSLTGNVANASTPYLVVSDLVGGNIALASRRANGTALATGPFTNMGHALSEDGSLIAFVADHADTTGVPAGTQVFASPRPQ